MREKTFLGTFYAITVASVSIWACGLWTSRTLSGWEFAHANILLASVFWIPLALLTFLALWLTRHKCRSKPALLVMATGVVPYAMLSSFVLADHLLPVLYKLLDGEAGAMATAFVGLLLAVQSAYVACAYLIADGEVRQATPEVGAGRDGPEVKTY